MLRLIKNSTFKGFIIFLLGPPLGGMFGCAGGFAYLMSPAHGGPTHPLSIAYRMPVQATK